jgi:hypothetical protein
MMRVARKCGDGLREDADKLSDYTVSSWPDYF